MRGGAVAARRAHNPKVAGSSPAPATHKKETMLVSFFVKLSQCHPEHSEGSLFRFFELRSQNDSGLSLHNNPLDYWSDLVSPQDG